MNHFGLAPGVVMARGIAASTAVVLLASALLWQRLRSLQLKSAS